VLRKLPFSYDSSVHKMEKILRYTMKAKIPVSCMQSCTQSCIIQLNIFKVSLAPDNPLPPPPPMSTHVIVSGAVRFWEIHTRQPPLELKSYLLLKNGDFYISATFVNLIIIFCISLSPGLKWYPIHGLRIAIISVSKLFCLSLSVIFALKEKKSWLDSQI